MPKLTKAETTKKLEGLLIENDELKAQLKDFKATADASGLFGYGGTSKEPETEVGYLRRELAYAQGQLHQSHLTVKELCRRGGLPATQPNTDVIRQAEDTLNRINNALFEIQQFVADQINRRDLAAAGVKKFVPFDEFNAIDEQQYRDDLEKHGFSAKKGGTDGKEYGNT